MCTWPSLLCKYCQANFACQGGTHATPRGDTFGETMDDVQNSFHNPGASNSSTSFAALHHFGIPLTGEVGLQVIPVYGTPLPCHHLFVFSHSDSTTINIQLSFSTACCIIDDFQRTRFLTCKNLSCPLYVTCGVSYATCTHLLEYFTLVASRTLLGVPPSWRCAELQVALTQHVSLECSVEFRHDRVHSVYGGREPQSCRELLPGYPSSGGGGPFLLSP